MTQTDKPYNSVSGAKYLGIANSTMLKYIEAGEFPNIQRVGGRWRIPKADLDAFIKKPYKKKA